MKTLLIYAALTIGACSSHTATDSANVIICTGKYSKAYHIKSDCYGLSNCKGEIKTVSLDDAIKLGRHSCSYCVK